MVLLHWTFFLIMVTSAIIYNLNFGHGKQLQYFLNYKCHRLYRTQFGKLLQRSTKESKNCNPSMARITLWAVNFSPVFTIKEL